MHELLPPLEAYRADLARVSDREQLTASDDTLLLVATTLRRVSDAHRMGGPAFAATHTSRIGAALANAVETLCRGTISVRPFDAQAMHVVALGRALSASAGDPGADAEALRALLPIAEDAEESGALLLAASLLADGLRAVPHAPPTERARALLQQARIARTLGDPTAARHYFDAAGKLARQYRLPAVEGRVAMGLGALAMTRGNYPEARECFARALSLADAKPDRDLAIAARQGLMIAAGTAGDFDAALAHGWAALQGMGDDRRRQVEVLINLAQLALESGHPLAALRGNLRALELMDGPRFQLPALAGVVAAAGQLGDVDLVRRGAAVIARTASDAFPYERARAIAACWRAERAVGLDVEAEASRARVRALAKSGGYFELLFATEREADAPAGDGMSSRPHADAASRDVIDQLERYDVSDAVLATVSTMG